MLIHIMVGDLERIMRYPEMGFMTEQEIPNRVRQAFHLLVDAGYTGHLIQ